MADKAYKVMWKKKHPKAPTAVMDYIMPDLGTLLRTLDRSENVSPGTTEFIYIHRHDGDGKVAEVYTHEAATGATVIDYREGDAGVRRARIVSGERSQQAVIGALHKVLDDTRKMADVTPKPRIRLTNPKSRPYIVDGLIYLAYEASNEYN